MRLYADTPARRTRQVVADLVIAVVAGAGIALGVALGLGVNQLARASSDLSGRTGSTGAALLGSAQQLSTVPAIGGQLSTPLVGLASVISSTGDTLATQATRLHALAWVLGAAVVLAAVAVAVLLWVVARWPWVRRASGIPRTLGPDELEALAAAAVSTRPLGRIRRLGPGVIGAWRAGNPAARDQLAGVELAALGLRGGSGRSGGPGTPTAPGVGGHPAR